MDRCIGESWVRWWRGFGSVEIGGLPMSPMMDRSRSLMMGWMWCDVGGVDLVAPWVKWFRRSGFVLSPIWVLCGFCVGFAVRHGLMLAALVAALIWWRRGSNGFADLVLCFRRSGFCVGFVWVLQRGMD